VNFKRLNTASEIRELISFHNRHSDYLVIDTETTDKDPRTAKLLDIQLTGVEPGSAVIFSHEFATLLLEINPRIILVAHNYKYDAHVLFRHGVDLLDRTWRDTMLIGHLLDENRESYSLDSYVKEYYNDDYKEKFWAKYKTYEESTEEDRVEYACRDIVYTGRIFTHFRKELEGSGGVPSSLVPHVHRLQSSLLRTEIDGIKVDLKYLEDLGVKLKRRIDELGPQMRSYVKDETDLIELQAWQTEICKRKTDRGKQGVVRPTFSFESPKQLSTLLYEYLGLVPQRNEKTRAITTDFSALERLRSAHPVVQLIQENRELQKVYGSYVTGTLDRLDDGRIYPQFRVNGTATGRISHSNPNLAQLPKSGGVRGIYVPDQGRVLISADYSQLEVIIEANLTSDKSLLRMLENGESKHDVTSRELGCDRSTAKTLNFALQYWCTAGKVAKLLGVSAPEGQKVFDKYWDVYSGSRELKKKTDRMVDEGIPITTVYGRKRRFGVRKRTQFDGDYRQAYNMLIQGTGADITSEAFYNVDEYLSLSEHGNALFTVHDEILIQAKPEHAEICEAALLHHMEAVGQRLDLKIPLKAQGSGAMERWLD